MIDKPELINLAELIQKTRQLIRSSPTVMPQQLEEMVTALMITMYLKGWKDGLRLSIKGNQMMLDDLNRVEKELVNLYNLQGK